MGSRLHDPKLTGSIMINDTELTASAEQLNNSVNPSIAPIRVTQNFTPNIFDHNNKTILLDNSSGLIITLPQASGSGAFYRFVTATEVLIADSIIFRVANNTDEKFVGVINRFDVGMNPAYSPLIAQNIDDIDTITFAANNTGGQIGDEIVFEDIEADRWFINGRAIATNPGSGVLTSVIFAA